MPSGSCGVQYLSLFNVFIPDLEEGDKQHLNTVHS